MQRSVGPALGADLCGLYMYYPTKVNPADAPTRDRDVPEPTTPMPPWWESLCNGHFDHFEQWLAAHGLPLDLSGIDYGELCGCDDLLLAPNSRLRSFERISTSPSVSSNLTLRGFRVVSCPRGRGYDDGRRYASLVPAACKVLDSLPREQFFVSSSFKGFAEPGALDLFSGRCVVAKQMVRYGCSWVLCYDWTGGPAQDLLLSNVRLQIEELIDLGAFLTCGAAPICASFSVAVTPPVRSSRFPRGLPGLSLAMRKKVREGNSHSDWMRSLVTKFASTNAVVARELIPVGGLEKFRSTASPNVFRPAFVGLEPAGGRPRVWQQTLSLLV